MAKSTAKAIAQSQFSNLPTGPGLVERSEQARDLFAFIGVGGTAALAYVLASKWLLGLGMPVEPYVLSAALYAVFVPIVYFAHRLVSFRSAVPHKTAFARYVSVQVMAATIAGITSFVVHSRFGMPTVAGSSVVILASSGFSFLALRSWAFRYRPLS